MLPPVLRIMSKKILELLKLYKEIETSDPESQLVHLKADLDRALHGAPLTEEERAVLTILYLEEPTEHPIRKLDKNGGQTGRPLGGRTQANVAKQIAQDKKPAAREMKTSRIIKRAAGKISEYLGEPYE